MFGKIICFVLQKHKRGVRIAAIDPPVGPGVPLLDWFRCSRCGATHTRTVRKAKVTHG